MKTLYAKLLFVLGLILLIGCLEYHESHPPINSISHQSKKEYIVQVKTENKTLKIPLEEYLIGVVAGEMPVSFELEALKAQVVASRTFALSGHLKVDNTIASQVYLTKAQMKKNWGKDYSKNIAKIKKAIQQTSYEVMTYQGQYISALFFSSSNGQTVNSEDYFNDQVAYLKSVDSRWDQETDPKYKRSQIFTKQQLASLFQTSSPQINITAYTSSGYVKTVIVNQKQYTGREVREKLGLASSCFQIELTNKGYCFTTYGNGHGVGMSQYGAQGMAMENKTYREILNHYYQNIEIKRID